MTGRSRSGDTDWLPGARRIASPNFDARPAGSVIDTVIVHYISLPPERFSGDAVERLFTNRLDPAAHPYFADLAGVRVSAHVFLRRRGELLQFVPCRARAWHAGSSRLLERERCNDFSIGIELEGSALRPFTATQYRRLDRLLRQLADLFPLRYIAGHDDVAPGRKFDPGPRFDWRRLGPTLRAIGISRPF
ncbi:MAG: 1,6-anhydro-N-acetylmuramyl-L-alanine amidase AmpD [Lautropia sp.]